MNCTSTWTPLLHQREHSIEVELPFLQVALGQFKLVPILVGGLAPGDAEKIAAALREYLTPSTLVVISSDFTHYGPNYDYLPFTQDVEQNLRKLDMGAVDLHPQEGLRRLRGVHGESRAHDLRAVSARHSAQAAAARRRRAGC